MQHVPHTKQAASLSVLNCKALAQLAWGLHLHALKGWVLKDSIDVCRHLAHDVGVETERRLTSNGRVADISEGGSATTTSSATATASANIIAKLCAQAPARRHAWADGVPAALIMEHHEASRLWLLLTAAHSLF